MSTVNAVTKQLSRMQTNHSHTYIHTPACMHIDKDPLANSHTFSIELVKSHTDLRILESLVIIRIVNKACFLIELCKCLPSARVTKFSLKEEKISCEAMFFFLVLYSFFYKHREIFRIKYD